MNAEHLLISVADLEHSLSNTHLRVVDCRWNLMDPNEGRLKFNESHIPTAQYVALEPDLSDPAGKSGRHPLPSKSRFAQVLGNKGINNDSTVIAYDDGTGVYACRLWWMLRWLGHRNVRVLDGGMQQWSAQGFAHTRSVTTPTTCEYSVGTQLTQVRSANDLLDTTLILIDARTDDRFKGQNETIDHTAGHIPGAVCYPFQENLNSDSTFNRQPDRFESLDASKSIVCYCGSGVSATHNIMALLLAGHDEPALYPGSWSEWIEDPNRPIHTN